MIKFLLVPAVALAFAGCRPATPTSNHRARGAARLTAQQSATVTVRLS